MKVIVLWDICICRNFFCRKTGKKDGDGFTKTHFTYLYCRRFPMQPSQYINTLLVPKDGRIPVDVDRLAAQGIFHVVCILFTIS